MSPLRRYAMGRPVDRRVAPGRIPMKHFFKRNPLRGGSRYAMSEISVKGLGLFVGFRFKF